MAWRRWLPAAAVLAASALFAVALLLPAPARGRIGGGAVFVLSSYAEAVSVAAFGVALAQTPRRFATAGAVLFAAGFLIGLAVKDPVLSALVRRPGAFERTQLLAPAGCILSGIALAAPGLRRAFRRAPVFRRRRPDVTGCLRAWAAPAIALLAGGAIGFTAALNDPTFGEWRFVTGAAAASFWLLLAPFAVVPHLPAAALRIASGILASWLVAIGLMLGAAHLYKRAPSAQGSGDIPPPARTRLAAFCMRGPIVGE